MTAFEQQSRVRAALAKASLTELEERVLFRKLRGERLADLADFRGVSDGSIRAALHRAVRKIRREIPDFKC